MATKKTPTKKSAPVKTSTKGAPKKGAGVKKGK